MVLKRAWSVAAVCFVGVCCGVGGALAQQATPTPPAPAPSPPTSLSVIVVDVQSLLQNSKAGKSVRAQMDPKAREFQQKRKELEQYAQTKAQALDKLRSTVTQEVFTERRTEAEKELRQRDEALTREGETLRSLNADAGQKVQNAALKIIKEVAAQRKANLVLQLPELVLFDKTWDVTDEVMQKLDAELPTVTIDFPAAASPAETPPPAAAAPAPKPKKK
jgi:Skp family chaperone for outer membrane proteins